MNHLGGLPVAIGFLESSGFVQTLAPKDEGVSLNC